MNLVKVVITPENGAPETFASTSPKANHVGQMLRSLPAARVKQNVISGGSDKGTTTLSANLGGKRFVGYFK